MRESIATLKAQKGDLRTAHSAKIAALNERITKLQDEQKRIENEQARLTTEISQLQNDASAIQARVTHLQSPAGQQEAVNQKMNEFARMGF